MRQCVSCATRFESGSSWTCPGCGLTPVTDAGIVVFAPALAAAISGYDTALFDAHGGELSEQSFWTRGRSALIHWALRRYVPNARRFLEVGCGTGGVLLHLERAWPELEMVGAEALVSGLHTAGRRLSRTTLMQMDATRIPFADEFDAVGAFDVIEHIEQDEAVLASMAAATRPGGVIVVTVPQHKFLFGPADVAARHVRRYTREELVRKVSVTGCRVELVTSFVSLLFPAMASLRLISRWRGGAYDSADEFQTGIVNEAGMVAMNLERRAIEHGARLPFGGSLLLVARKA